MYSNLPLLEPSKTDKAHQLIIIPSYLNSLGGMMVSLVLLIKGVQRLGLAKNVRVLVKTDTLLEDYFIKAGLADCLEILKTKSYFKSALQWVEQQPTNWPLLLDNSVSREKLPPLLRASLRLRLSKRPIYHFCHDLALSYNQLGYLTRKVTFACLSPKAICNSQYTANHISSIMPNICGILYQPVDLEKIAQRLSMNFPPPDNLKPILDSGAKIILTPSRINQPGIVNDKNLRALLPVVAELKRRGHFYHAVIIGQDNSEGKTRTKDLLQQAKTLGIADRLSILPPTFNIEDYYKFSDLVVTLAPREPFGRTVVEAISCHLPVIGSNTGGIKEILQNFAPDWTVAPKDYVSVANKIVQVESNPETAKNLEKGQQWVKQHCCITDYAKGIMKIVGLLPKELDCESLLLKQ